MTPTEAASTLRALGWRCEPPEVLAAATLAAPATEAPTEPVEGQAWVTATGTELRVLRVCDQYVTLDAGGRQIPRAAWAVWVRLFGARPVIAQQTAPALQPAPAPHSEPDAPLAPPQAPRVGEVWEAPLYNARTVGRVNADRAWFHLPDDNRLFSVRLDRWRAWVRRAGARVVG